MGQRLTVGSQPLACEYINDRTSRKCHLYHGDEGSCECQSFPRWQATRIYAMRDRCTQDLPLQAFTFPEDLRTFQAALKWFRKRAKVDLLPGDFVVNCRSLYVLGYSRPTKGISYRVRHVCEPDPRAHLQDLLMQRSARKWRFDFHINPPHVNIP